jgi:hypothetical protein
MTIQTLCSLSAVPAHYVLSNAATGGPSSAESIRSAESSLVAKVKRRMIGFGQAWEEAMRLALAVERGDVPTSAEAMETVWANPEVRNDAQAADAAQKKKDLGVPFRQLAEDLGYSPVQVERMLAERQADGLGLDARLRGVGGP